VHLIPESLSRKRLPGASAVHEIVLVGGGHAHVEVVRRWGRKPAPAARLTLVSRAPRTYYSGMLPGVLAGHYAREDAAIDLVALAARAGACFLEAEASGLDREAKRLSTSAGDLAYDLLSLDIGSGPRLEAPGAAEHAIPVRPVETWLDRAQALVERARGTPLRIVIVGGGPTGVELALSLDHRLSRESAAAHSIALVTDGRLLAGRGEGTARLLRRVLAERGVGLFEHAPVASVEQDAVLLADGRLLPSSATLWAAGAGAPAWLGETGLALDVDGFVAVLTSYRSVNDDSVFAAGDCATILAHPRPKAGVHAVRAGPFLAANLGRTLENRPLREHRPQREHLALITTGGRHAVGSRGPIAFEGRWVWHLKDCIDRRFMRRYAGA